MNINSTYGEYTTLYESSMEFCYGRRVTVKSDFCIGMQLGIRYCCIKDILIVDAAQEDGNLQKIITEFQCHTEFKHNYKLIPSLNMNGDVKEYTKCTESGAIGG